MRKHPVILGLVLLIALAAVIYLVFYRAGSQSGRSAKQSFSLNDKIGVVPVEGVFTDSLAWSRIISNEFAEDTSIAAVVIRIDSPRRRCGGSQEIYDAIVALKKKEKVVVFHGVDCGFRRASDRLCADTNRRQSGKRSPAAFPPSCSCQPGRTHEKNRR
jgi:protease-4